MTTLQTYALERMTGVLGARVHGLDLSQPLDEETMSSLRGALYEYWVLVFTGQPDLTVEEQIAFGRNWGELITMPPEVDLVEVIQSSSEYVRSRRQTIPAGTTTDIRTGRSLPARPSSRSSPRRGSPRLAATPSGPASTRRTTGCRPR